jgi:hypothetical protein
MQQPACNDDEVPHPEATQQCCPALPAHNRITENSQEIQDDWIFRRDTLYLQKDSLGKGKESNWLPTPEGEFWVVFRSYGPSEEIVNQAWKMPGLKKIL